MQTQTEAAMVEGTTYNFCLVNYYASCREQYILPLRRLQPQHGISIIGRETGSSHEPQPSHPITAGTTALHSGQWRDGSSHSNSLWRPETWSSCEARHSRIGCTLFPNVRAGEASNGRLSPGVENYYHYNVRQWRDLQVE